MFMEKISTDILLENLQTCDTKLHEKLDGKNEIKF
jgi:hypothetical protein